MNRRAEAVLCCLIAAAAVTAWAATDARPRAGQVKMSIPAHDPAYGPEGAIPILRVKLENMQAKAVIHIESGQTVHNFLIDPENPWLVTNGSASIADSYLLFEEGPRRISVQALDYSTRKVLAEATVSLDVKKPDREAMKEEIEHNAYWQIAAAAQTLREADKVYRREYFDSRMGDAAAKARLRWAADEYLERRTRDFLWRISAYALLSEYYERNFRPEQARLALECADEIYEKEKGTTFTGPDFALWPITNSKGGPTEAPGHFWRYACYYARRGDRDKAIDWYRKQAEWYEAQAKAAHLTAEQKAKARQLAAQAYRGMAQLEVILKNNIDRYETWMGKSREALAPANAAQGAPDEAATTK